MKKTLLTITTVGLMLSGFSAYAVSEIWQTNFETAKKEAAAKKQPILAVFSGSDWCSWCMKLDKEILSKDEFKNFAKDKLVLFLADFPSSKKLPEATAKQNQELSEKYDVKGFPTVLILNADGKVIGKTGYMAGGPKKYVEHLKTMINTQKEEAK